MSAVILTSLGGMGVMANLALIAIIVINRPLMRCGIYPLHCTALQCTALHRWSQGLIFHQALVDCARAGILLPLGARSVGAHCTLHTG
jgi:hypothetical protein